MSTPIRAAFAAVALLLFVGCARSEDPSPRAGETVRLPVDVIADSGASVRWKIRPPAPPGPGAGRGKGVTEPGASVWLARVEPTRSPTLEPPLPAPDPGTLEVEPPEPPRLEIDEDLKPPILRRSEPLRIPALRPSTRHAASVELDVRVDEEGRVSDAAWAGGSSDSLLVRAATDCALSMEFFPALQSGRPVAVWCRQRFDFGSR